MKKEYDLSKMKRRPGKVKVDKSVLKTAISIRIDTNDMISISEESHRLGIPYQTLINSVIHRFVTGQLIDRKDLKAISEILKSTDK